MQNHLRIFNSCSPEIKAKFKNDLRKLASIREPFVICGDLDCRHKDRDCTRANSWGNILSEIPRGFPVIIKYPVNSTYIPANIKANPSILDLILSNVPHNITQPITLNDLGSDHLPVQFSLNMNAIISKKMVVDHKNSDVKKYKKLMKESLPRIQINLALQQNNRLMMLLMTSLPIF